MKMNGLYYLCGLTESLQNKMDKNLQKLQEAMLSCI